MRYHPPSNAIAVMVSVAVCQFWSVLAPAPLRAEEPRRVEVELSEFAIDMPDRLPPGPTVLEFVNVGQAEHTVAFRRNGEEWELERTLMPGQSGTLELDLRAGTYYVYCPIGRHEGLGMHMELTVAEAGPDAGTESGAEASAKTAPSAEPSPTPAPGRPALTHHTPPRPGDLGTATGVKKVAYWLGSFHPPAVSFPIALLTAALLAEGLLAATGRQRYDTISRFCVRLGTATGLAAGVLGWLFAGFRITDSVELMTIHRWLGTGTVAWAALVLVLSERSRRPDGAKLRPWFRAALAIAVLAVLTTGFFGGAMIYGLDHYAWW